MELSQQDLAALEISRAQKAKDLRINIRELEEASDTLIYVNESLQESKARVSKPIRDSETIVLKLLLHTQSIIQTLRGTHLKSKYYKEANKKIVDLPSLRVLIRAQFEALLMYNHVYVNSKDNEDMELRYYAWMYEGIYKRASHIPRSDEAKRVYANDLKTLERFRSIITSNPHYQNLTTAQQRTIVKSGNSRLFKSWKDIIRESGFRNDGPVEQLYSMLSDYAHSGSLSIIQLQSAKLGYSHIHEQTSIMAFNANCIVCLLTMHLIKMHRICNIKFNTLPIGIQTKSNMYGRLLLKI